MRRVYCISGLGADERIFQKLHVEGIQFNCLRWLDPLGKESIADYSKRMVSQLDEKEPLLMGVSFGGMMALEISKHVATHKVILLSSIKSREELPPWMKFSGQCGLNRFIPQRPWKWLGPIENHFLGTEGSEEEEIANSFREKVDPRYLRWAIDQVLNWKNHFRPPALYHVHGTHDKTFPIKRIKATHIIKGGGHFMVMNRAEEISRILQKIITQA
jgi:pimeloyl-ACP methyl ester carboxylesterase